MHNKFNWLRVNHTVNGVPRYVCSWLEFNTNTYAEAITLANTIGGRKYRGKDFAGGIVFQSFNVFDTERQIIELITPKN